MTIHSVVIQKLLTTNSHISRQTVTHHFKQFTYGIRNKQAILDSDKTLICLRNALNFITCLSRDPSSSFLFINTNPLFQPIIDEMTLKVTTFNPERVSNLWKMRGFLTNSFSPKKFRSRNKKLVFGPTRLPDCVVVFDTERKSSILSEAQTLGIPIVGLVDSSTPLEFYKKVTYPIPANDSVQFVYLVCNMITKCLMLEKKKKEGEKRIGRKATSREEVKQIEESTGESKVESANEVLVIPYDNLAPLSGDIADMKQLLDKLVVVKFNGALGKNMGFNGPKSLIEVKNGSTSLDLTVNQIQSLNSKYGCNVPLLLINSRTTHDDVLKVLEKYSSSKIDIHSFRQGDQIQQELSFSEGGEDEWYSSDHGAQFLSLMSSGTLDVLLSQGKEYALVVNPDNVAAVVDPQILNHLAQNSVEYCMEVMPTTSGGLMNFMASSLQGKFKLEDFTSNPTKHSVKKFKFIDTRNLWVDLRAIKRLVDTNALKLGYLSMLKLFEKAIGIMIPQSRFLPLNSTSDLLLFQSDLYSFTEGVLIRNDARTTPTNPSIDLGPEFEKVSDFQSRFKTIPSIIRLDSLEVTGDVWFGADITLKGRVRIAADPGVKLEIPDGVVLKNEGKESSRGYGKTKLHVMYFSCL
ncbi:UTP--glucose-1-phosphate uridylyltransferase, putative isoform 2 [Theobroma cacao]|uniref:UTP--glucose-1-phosphate uridylyltransferase n=1 Tax=Theobroma cacao TaxID=3641 RepID=A0A061EZZ9_THECC|nr:UTP--glucose-1-phosphate uridylyltransferase, putative isoform 2 [Theobroma cacao]